MASAVGETKRILFKSVITDKYARPIDEDRYNGYLSADGKGDPRMYLEETSSGSGLYRIKSGDTNKYWQVKSHENPWITADADPHAVADPDRTLFQIECFVRPFIPVTPATYVPPATPVAPVVPVTLRTHTTVRLRHNYLKGYACLYPNQDYPYCLKLSDKPDEDSKDVFVCEKFT